MRTIVVAEYNPDWPAQFDRIRDYISPALSGMDAVIEHVGSTSVPGLRAKPVIDIDIVIVPGTFDHIKDILAGIGYSHRGDLGVSGRESFSNPVNHGFMNHHLCICERGTDELPRHLALRDFLRNNPEYVRRYGDIKCEAAKLYPHDIDAYILHKESVIMEIYGLCGLDNKYKINPIRGNIQ